MEDAPYQYLSPFVRQEVTNEGNVQHIEEIERWQKQRLYPVNFASAIKASKIAVKQHWLTASRTRARPFSIGYCNC